MVQHLHEVPRSMHIVAAVTAIAWPAGEAAAAHLWRARARRCLRSGPDVVCRRDLNGARKRSSCARTLAGTLALFHRCRRSRLLRTPAYSCTLQAGCPGSGLRVGTVKSSGCSACATQPATRSKPPHEHPAVPATPVSARRPPLIDRQPPHATAAAVEQGVPAWGCCGAVRMLPRPSAPPLGAPGRQAARPLARPPARPSARQRPPPRQAWALGRPVRPAAPQAPPATRLPVPTASPGVPPPQQPRRRPLRSPQPSPRRPAAAPAAGRTQKRRGADRARRPAAPAAAAAGTATRRARRSCRAAPRREPARRAASAAARQPGSASSPARATGSRNGSGPDALDGCCQHVMRLRARRRPNTSGLHSNQRAAVRAGEPTCRATHGCQAARAASPTGGRPCVRYGTRCGWGRCAAAHAAGRGGARTRLARLSEEPERSSWKLRGYSALDSAEAPPSPSPTPDAGDSAPHPEPRLAPDPAGAAQRGGAADPPALAGRRGVGVS